VKYLPFTTEQEAKTFSHNALIKVGRYVDGNTCQYLYPVYESMDGKWYVEIEKEIDTALTVKEKTKTVDTVALVKDDLVEVKRREDIEFGRISI